MKQALDSRHSCRLLQLDGPPQALAFSNNAGDLVFALGSRLCLVSHKLYLPTSYLVEVYSQSGQGGTGCCTHMVLGNKALPASSEIVSEVP